MAIRINNQSLWPRNNYIEMNLQYSVRWEVIFSKTNMYYRVSCSKYKENPLDFMFYKNTFRKP